MSEAFVAQLALDEATIEAIASRAAEIVLQHLEAGQPTACTFLSVPEAAVYLRCKPQRIYDLLSAQRLTRHKDGRRVLVARAELDDYLAGRPLRRIAPTLPPVYQRRIPRELAR